MKALFIALTMLIGTTIYAAKPINFKPEHPDLHSFYLSFPDAKEVKWEQQNNMFRITFVQRGETLFAYYSNEGEVLAITRNILESQLPIIAAAELHKKLEGKYLINLFEVSMNDETTYYATVSDTRTKTILKAQPTGYWSTFKKSRIKKNK